MVPDDNEAFYKTKHLLYNIKRCFVLSVELQIYNLYIIITYLLTSFSSSKAYDIC